MNKIINFGSCNIDYVYELDHIVSPGETEATRSLHVFPGGKGLNQSIAVARAGSPVFHAGLIGSDGEMLRGVMTESGVNTDWVLTSEEKSGHAIIQVTADGENSIFLYPGANRAFDGKFIETVLENFTSDDVLILQNEINCVETVIRSGYEKGMRVCFTPSPISDDLRDLDLGMLSYLLLNEVEARALSGSDDAETGIERLCARYPHLKVVLTLGKNGCVYITSTERIYHPTFTVPVVDTTAAGDTFAGYFISAITSGIAPADALKRASAAAALCISRNGASPSIPTSEEVDIALTTLALSRNTLDDKKRALTIRRYISEHTRGASLKELAEILGYSVTYTGALVKRIMGAPFSKLLEDTRCRMAAEMLAETELPVQEIIYRVGYENENFFRKLFSERYGKTPLEYRKKETK
ncbi:MAG: helix-turn-helix domain-containing protein [Clostridia bacterium]|nr:helix-turn-helix domain-containing protein [Clostridia bacterium]